MKSKIKNLKSNIQSGQSLVEMVVAIAIIVTGLVGALSLTISNLSGAGEAGARVVASNLAKEGIDVVRNIRDTNWLKDLAWDSGLSLAGDFTAIAVFDPSQNLWHLDFTPASISDPAARLYRDANDLYLQNMTSPTGTETLFSRLLTIDPICLTVASPPAENITGNSCGVGENQIGVRVKSEIDWTESGQPRSLILEDRLYNWQ